MTNEQLTELADVEARCQQTGMTPEELADFESLCEREPQFGDFGEFEGFEGDPESFERFGEF